MRALVTRPIEDAAPLAEALKVRGVEPVVVPMMRIAPIGAPPNLDGVTALLFTSANGVRAFAIASDRRDLPSFAVGGATAAALRDKGFVQIESAGGDVAALAALVAERLDPKAGRLLHVAGSEVAGDLAGELTAKGFSIERAVLYHAVPIERLPDSLVADLQAGRIDSALLFSPRTATLFAERVRAAGLEPSMRRITALCLSRAVAEAADLPFAAKRVAAKPEQAALLALLDQPPAPEAPAAAPGAARPAIVGGLAGLLAASVIAAIAVATASDWLPAPPTPTPDPALAAKLDALTRDMAALRATPAPAPPDLKPLNDRLTALEQSLASLQAKLDQTAGQDAQAVTALNERIAAATQQIAALQQQLSDVARSTEGALARSAEEATRHAALALAAAQLGQSLASGQPFAPSLVAVLGLVDDADLKSRLAALQPAAEHGIPTTEALARRFGAVARDAKAASVKEQAGGSWLGEIKGLLAGLVTIRPTDPARGGDDLDNRLARAGAYVAAGDLAQAAAEMQALPPPAAASASRWLADAEQRLAADAAVKDLEARAAAALAAGKN